jgi:hypothetical protein
MSRFREIKRLARGVLHNEMKVAALYIYGTSDPVECNVRVWLKTENQMVGDLQGFAGAERAEPEDRIRFDINDIPIPRKNGIVSVEAGEAYRIDHLYPVDMGYQTARVVRLSTAEAESLPVPEDYC